MIDLESSRIQVYPVQADVNTISKKEADARVEEGLADDDAGLVVVAHAARRGSIQVRPIKELRP